MSTPADPAAPTLAPAAAAPTALACLDLTSLNDSETAADIERLCRRATGRFGATAAVCVWPRRPALARSLLPREVAVATHEARSLSAEPVREVDAPWRTAS